MAKMEVVDFGIDGCGTDSEIVTKDRIFNVHSQILSSSSPYFKSAFDDVRNSTKKGKRKIFIGDEESNNIWMFLKAIYPLRGPSPITFQNVQKLLELSDRFDVRQVTNSCEVFLRDLLSEARDDKCQLLGWAVKYDMQNLKRDVLMNFAKVGSNILNLKNSRTWPELGDEGKAELLGILLDKTNSLVQYREFKDFLKYF